MSRINRPPFVDVYFSVQSLKFQPTARMKYEEAVRAVAEGRGAFHYRRRKIVLAAAPHKVSEDHISQRSDSALNRGDANALACNNRLPEWRRQRIEAWGPSRA